MHPVACVLPRDIMAGDDPRLLRGLRQRVRRRRSAPRTLALTAAPGGLAGYIVHSVWIDFAHLPGVVTPACAASGPAIARFSVSIG